MPTKVVHALARTRIVILLSDRCVIAAAVVRLHTAAAAATSLQRVVLVAVSDCVVRRRDKTKRKKKKQIHSDFRTAGHRPRLWRVCLTTPTSFVAVLLFIITIIYSCTVINCCILFQTGFVGVNLRSCVLFFFFLIFSIAINIMVARHLRILWLISLVISHLQTCILNNCGSIYMI